MATPTGDGEQVRYDILIEAKAAIQAMRDMMKYTSDNTVKMAEFTNQVLADSKRWGVSWQQALGVYRQLNAELSKQKKGTLFGQTGGQDLFGQTEKYITSMQEAGRLTDDVTKKTETFGQKTESAGKRAARGVDVVRIALGAIVSMILFRAIQAVEMFFRGAIEQARQFEDTLYRLRNVEESLSMQGIEISMSGLKKGITDIQKLLPIFSKEDISQLVGTLAISTKQLGLNEQQILDLAKAIGILNIRSEKQEDISTTAQHVLSSLLTGNAKGITALGIAFTDNVMRAKAMELGFLKADEALSTLSENEKGITKLNIVLASTADETANVGEYLDTNSAKIQQNAAAWKDFQTTVGQILLPLIPVVTGFIQVLTDASQVAKVVIIELITILGALGVVMTAVFAGKIGSIGQFTDVLQESIDTFRETLVNDFFQEQPENAPAWFQRGWGHLIKEEAETATGPVQDLGAALEELEEIDLSKLEQEIQDIIENAANAREDLAENLDRKLEDLGEEYRRKEEDALRDLRRKEDDINQDYERDLADLRRRHREEDQKDEARYQLALWELRQRFLMDLEDALHARDARQVLRLQKQYAIDKEALRRKHELENTEREQGQRDEVQDLAQRRDERLAEARLEYERKLADLRVAKQREQEDLQKWYEREQADIEQAMQRKLETLLKGWIDEKKITEQNAAEVYAILSKYFGPGGLTDSLYAYMMSSLIASTQGAIAAGMAAMSGIVGGGIGGGGHTQVLTPSTSNGGSDVSGGHGSTPKSALLPTPTASTGSPVSITPLNQIASTANSSFSGSGASGMSGQIQIAVDLSPDLEARVVEKSMNGVGEIITRVNRSK
jgi:hypothetical protein